MTLRAETCDCDRARRPRRYKIEGVLGDAGFGVWAPADTDDYVRAPK